jgi:hypothetical protein
MFPKNNDLNNTIRLTSLLLTAGLAGCSLNPFSKDDAPAATAPVANNTAASSGTSAMNSSSMNSTTRAEPVPYEPKLEQVSRPVPLADGHPDEYVVQVGDTLWDISGKFLKDPWYWPEIWYVNPEIVNPHLIYPGDVLGLVYIDGVPRITNVRASTYRLSPQARVTPLNEAINSIPYDSISAFLRTGVVLEKKQAESLPYILQSRGDHLIAAAGNDVYVRGTDSVAPGARYSVVHIGDELIDPDDNRTVGYHGIWVGEGTLRRSGDPATMALTSTAQEAIRGDRLIPETIDIPLNFFPKAPGSQIDGRIISVVGGVTQIGQHQVVVLNRGTSDGLNTGDVLSVFQTGAEVEDKIEGGKVKLPDEQAGTIMVFKVYNDISYALVMEATQAIHIHDAVRNPI